MKLLLKILVSALAVFFAAYVLRGVFLDGFTTALLVAMVLAVLNMFVKPILVILTIPFTLVTFGLFLLVINAVIILLVDWILPGFEVDGFITAFLFAIIVSVTTWMLEAIVKTEKTK